MESRGRRPRTPERQRPAARKVPVVYYLTRSRHLEHPHFVEVPVASPEGLYLRGQSVGAAVSQLQLLLLHGLAHLISFNGACVFWGFADVINHLNTVRGKGMAAMYSWSCKR